VQPGGDLGHDAAVRHLGQQDRELVAAEPRQEVAPADDRAEAARDLDEQLVAVIVAERVVDLLEAVEVDEQERGGAARAPRVGDRTLRAPVQEHAVGQAGERVVQRLAAQAARGPGHNAEERRVEEHEAGPQDGEEPPGVFGDGAGHGLVGQVGLQHALDRASYASP